MKVAICQVDTTVGDFAGNCARIRDFAERAARQGARLAVFPELALCGYPPEDLLLSRGFLASHDEALHVLASQLPGTLHVLVGCIERNSEVAAGGRDLRNAVAHLHDGTCTIVARKSLLPTYDVFDEARYFEPWQHPARNLLDVDGTRVGIVVCEDGWNDSRFFERRQYPCDPVELVVAAGAQLVVNLSASPWSHGKERFRHRMVAAAAARHRVPMVYVNQVGGNVDMQFDGSSLACKPEGLAFAPVAFAEHLAVVDTDSTWTVAPEWLPDVEATRLALVQGIRAYCTKFGFATVVLGLSGGIDSALVATLAADAIGPANVMGIAMPSKWSSAHSLEDAAQLAHNLGIGFLELPIGPLQDAFEHVLAPAFVGTVPGVAEENLQARARGTLLMAWSNKHGHMLLTTGNKSECAVGYCTLYGDMCGALAPIADLWKTEVWELSRWINRERVRIPERSITKAPSAELRPGQFDTDSLPPYELLDPVLKCLVEEQLDVATTAARTGMARERVAELHRMVSGTEYKRFQYAPTLRVSERCWGGRRMPVSHRHRER